MLREAQADEDVVAITAAMEGGTGLKPFAQMFPDRFIDVGIAEEQALGMASGLAAGGKKPVVAIYSTFMQRAIDQMITNISLPDFNVVFDIAYTRMIPHMRVLAPSDEAELVHALHTALALGGPFAVRYPRGAGEGVEVPEVAEVLAEGVSREVRAGDDVAILAFGKMVARARAAADILAEHGIDARVVDMRWVKPLDRRAIERAAETKLVVTVEEGIVSGGAGEGVLDVLAELGALTPSLVLGVVDRFVSQGKVDLLLRELGLDAEGIASAIERKLA